jgi:hypothetical protein
MDENHPFAAFQRPKAKASLKVPYPVDPDELSLPLYQEEIGVVAACHLPAREASITAVAGARVITVQHPRQGKRSEALAYPVEAGEEQGMGKLTVPDGLMQETDHSLLSDDFGKSHTLISSIVLQRHSSCSLLSLL